MLKLSELAVDVDAIDNGVWVDEIPDLPGVRFLVRGSEYEPYKKALASFHTKSDIMKSRRGRLAQLQDQNVDTEKFVAFMSAKVAEHLLLGWDGLDVGITPELALEVMTDRKWVNLKRGVMFAVEAVDTGLAEHREVATGN
jgi:hypothetical protein